MGWRPNRPLRPSVAVMAVRLRLQDITPVATTVAAWPQRYWIAEADVDGYRITAASHVTADFTVPGPGRSGENWIRRFLAPLK